VLLGLQSTAFAGGNVLPTSAQPLGWSLDDMASAIADFSITGNDPAFYPNTPFQILFRNPPTANTFTVKPGTFLYVKFFFIDDSPPVVGDWPADKSGAANYVFGRSELGGHNFQLTVDGKTTSLDNPGYIGGPVATPNSPDGSQHLIQIGAFVNPLNKGIHKITIGGVLDGDAALVAFQGPFAGSVTYTVIVN